MNSENITISSKPHSIESFPHDNIVVAVRVTYKEKIDAFRALGNVLSVVFSSSNYAEAESKLEINQTRQFDTTGPMIDCSRGAVPSVSTIFYLIRIFALTGFNTLQLYLEDVYEIPGESLFGYLRGRYTQKELLAIDLYADIFGIEVFPCIQTLGHLANVLQWDCYSNIRDTPEILLADCEATYAFIEKMILAATKPFKSRRVHIGMDEAIGAGSGTYKKIFRESSNSNIFLNHLKRVAKICKDNGLHPLFWSDLIFDTGDGGAPYNINCQARFVKSDINESIDAVYWDYYRVNPNDYTERINYHRRHGFEPWVAGGIWTWNRFFTAIPFTIASSSACIVSCKRNNIKNMIITTWGDDGGECDLISSLPGFIFYGEHLYSKQETVHWEAMCSRFAAICGGNFAYWAYASSIDQISVEKDIPSNMSKWLLWQDPFYSFWNVQCENINLKEHYTEIYKNLEIAMNVNPKIYPLNARLRLPYLIAKVLSIKVVIRSELKAAYNSCDPKGEISKILINCVCPLIELVDELWKHHRDLWLSTFKPFGLEILEMRYGAIRTRLASLFGRLEAFCNSPDSMMGVDYQLPENNTDFVLSPEEMGSPKKRNSLINNHKNQYPQVNNTIPELEEDLYQPYPTNGTKLILSFIRAFTPASTSWTT